MSTPKILFLGGGNMGGAMIEGLLSTTPRPEVALIDPNPTTRDQLGRRFAITTHASADPALRADAIVLAVKPQVLVGAIQQARPVLAANPDAIVISIAAGTSMAMLRAASGNHRQIARAMPNTPALIGQGITALYLPEDIDPAAARLAERVLASTGAVVRLAEERALDAVTAVSGSGPAYVFYLIEAMMAGARAEGLSADQARALVLATVRGAALLADRSEDSAEDLRLRVTSPNGTTAAAIATFDRCGVRDGIVAGIAAACRRSEELGRMT